MNNNLQSRYCTLISGTIKQLSALSVGGAAQVDEPSDACYRDGRNRLTIPGTSLAGALIETAARLFPELVADAKDESALALTGKLRGIPQKNEARRFLQSVWRFHHAHLVDEKNVSTEWRQGVGIRQATGATAARKRTLYDFEVVPRGAQWSFFLEIDTRRLPVAEHWAVAALNEWCIGRGWLGRSPARGTGWIKLDIDPECKVLRLPGNEKMLEIWPDNTKAREDGLKNAKAAGAASVEWDQALREARDVLPAHGRGQWHYLYIPVTLEVGSQSKDSYGLDVLQVGGHPAGETVEDWTGFLQPVSVDKTAEIADAQAWRGEYRQPDSPFVRTTPVGARLEPFLPGGGLRGPLRHAASRLARGGGQLVRDPNRSGDPAAKNVEKEMSTAGADQVLSDFGLRHLVAKIGDQLTDLFGAEELCGRLLVRDAKLVGSDFTLAQTEHHAEDEFAGGVFGGSKFDRHSLVRGKLQFQMLLEGENLAALRQRAQRLAPALELARLGHLPVGGSKWRGAGWTPWQIGSMSVSRAGGDQPIATSAEGANSIDRRIAELFSSAQVEHA